MLLDIEGDFKSGERVNGEIQFDADFPFVVVVVMLSVVVTRKAPDEFITFGKTQKVLERLIEFHEYRISPRLVSLVLTGPNGEELVRLAGPEALTECQTAPKEEAS